MRPDVRSISDTESFIMLDTSSRVPSGLMASWPAVGPIGIGTQDLPPLIVVWPSANVRAFANREVDPLPRTYSATRSSLPPETYSRSDPAPHAIP